MSSLADNLLEAFSTIARNEAKSADQSIEATIVNNDDYAKNIYTVEYLGNTFKASYLGSVPLAVGANIYVTIPGGDFSKEKTIIGLVDPISDSNTEAAIEDKKPTYLEISDNLISNIKKTIGLSSYKKQDIKNVTLNETTSVISGNEVLLSNYTKTYKTLKLSVYMKTDLAESQKVLGNYGIRITIPVVNTVVNKDKTETVTYLERVYTLDSSDMLGNPYSYNTVEGVYQELVIELQNGDVYNSLKTITMECYSGNFATNKDKENVEDIFFNDIGLSVVQKIPEQSMSGYFLSIVSNEGFYFVENGKSYVKKLEPKFFIDGKENEPSSLNIPCYWFERSTSVVDTNSKGYHHYGGTGWKILNPEKGGSETSDGVYVPSYQSNYYSISVDKKDVYLSKKYKCVVVYNGVEVSAETEIQKVSSKSYLKIESLSGTNKFDREIGTVSLKTSFEYGEIPAGSEIIFTWKLLDQEDKYLTTFTNDGYNTTISSINYIYKDQKLNGATQNLNFSSSMIRDGCCKVAVGAIIKYVENDIIEEIEAGIETITLFTDESEVGNRLMIMNADVAYKYDLDGDSPRSNKYDGPASSAIETIKPLSFKMFKSDGVELTPEEYKVCQVEWQVPKNSLIKILNKDKELFKQEVSNLDEVTKKDSSYDNPEDEKYKLLEDELNNYKNEVEALSEKTTISIEEKIKEIKTLAKKYRDILSDSIKFTQVLDSLEEDIQKVETEVTNIDISDGYEKTFEEQTKLINSFVEKLLGNDTKQGEIQSLKELKSELNGVLYTYSSDKLPDEDDEYYYVKGNGQLSLAYDIEEEYNPNYAENSDVTLTVTFRDDTVTITKNLLFMKEGDNGTNSKALSAAITYQGYTFGRKDKNKIERKLKFIYVNENKAWYLHDPAKNTLDIVTLSELNDEFYDNNPSMTEEEKQEGKNSTRIAAMKDALSVQVFKDGVRYYNYDAVWEMYDEVAYNACMGVTNPRKAENEDSKVDLYIPSTAVWDKDSEGKFKIFCNIVKVKITVNNSAGQLTNPIENTTNTNEVNNTETVCAFYPIEITRLEKLPKKDPETPDLRVLPSLNGGFHQVTYTSDGTCPMYDDSRPFICENDLDDEFKKDVDYKWEPNPEFFNIDKISYSQDNGYVAFATISPKPSYRPVNLNGFEGKYIKVGLKTGYDPATIQEEKDKIIEEQKTTNLIQTYYKDLEEGINIVRSSFDSQISLLQLEKHEKILSLKANLINAYSNYLEKLVQLKEWLDNYDHYTGVSMRTKIEDYITKVDTELAKAFLIGRPEDNSFNLSNVGNINTSEIEGFKSCFEGYEWEDELDLHIGVEQPSIKDEFLRLVNELDKDAEEGDTLASYKTLANNTLTEIIDYSSQKFDENDNSNNRTVLEELAYFFGVYIRYPLNSSRELENRKDIPTNISSIFEKYKAHEEDIETFNADKDRYETLPLTQLAATYESIFKSYLDYLKEDYNGNKYTAVNRNAGYYTKNNIKTIIENSIPIELNSFNDLSIAADRKNKIALATMNDKGKQNQLASINSLLETDEDIIHIRPIVITTSPDGLSYLGDWDGNKIYSGNDSKVGDYFFAPQIGAGKQDTYGFTGMIMGCKYVAPTKNDKASIRTGLFGMYGGSSLPPEIVETGNKSVQTIFLDAETGMATFGSELLGGSIKLDPTGESDPDNKKRSAIIYSSDYYQYDERYPDKPGSGMLISFGKEPGIWFGSGGFSVDSNGVAHIGGGGNGTVAGWYIKEHTLESASADGELPSLVLDSNYTVSDVETESLKTTGAIYAKGHTSLKSTEHGFFLNENGLSCSDFFRLDQNKLSLGNISGNNCWTVKYNDQRESYIAYRTEYLGEIGNSTTMGGQEVYLGTDGIRLGTSFYVNNFGKMYVGNLTSSSGDYWTIDGNSATQNSYISYGGLIKFSENVANNPTDSVYLGTDGITLGNKFSVTSNGKLYCSDAELSGKIYSTGHSSFNSTTPGYYLGSEGISLGEYFSVNENGTMKLGGDSSVIYSGGHSNLGSTENGFYLSSDGLSIGNSFSVDSSGLLTAYSVSLTGDIGTRDWDYSSEGPGYFLGEDGLNIGGKFKVDAADGKLTSNGDIETVGQLYAHDLKVVEKIGFKRYVESEFDTANDYIVNWIEDVSSDAFISKRATGECIYFGYPRTYGATLTCLRGPNDIFIAAGAKGNEETGEGTNTVYVRNAYLVGESKANKIRILNKDGFGGAIESITFYEDSQVSGNITQHRTNYTLTFSGGNYNASLVVSSDWH